VPDDTGPGPVSGALVGLTADRISIARQRMARRRCGRSTSAGGLHHYSGLTSYSFSPLGGGLGEGLQAMCAPSPTSPARGEEIKS